MPFKQGTIRRGTSPDAAVHALESRAFDLVLMDLNYTGDTTSGREGIDLLSRVQEFDRLLPVIVMTGWGSVDLAVEAMRRGVRDFVQKPWDNAHLLATLRQEIEAGRARRKADADERRELAEALRIQTRLLPQQVPQIDGWALSVSWQPASGVGGDCFDTIRFSDTRLALTIADVVGKGIPAALLMSNLQAAVRAFASEAAEPQALCLQVNRILCGNIAEGRFISFFYCVLDATAGVLTYTNAGHYLPMLVRADGSVDRLGIGGPVLGVLPEAEYEQASVTSTPAIGWCLHRRIDRSARRRGPGIRRGPPARSGRHAPGLQRAGAPGAAHRGCRRLHRWAPAGRCDADGAGG